MPATTITPMAFGRLLEPKSTVPNNNNNNNPPSSASPIPNDPSSSPTSPSPYLFNRKRQGDYRSHLNHCQNHIRLNGDGVADNKTDADSSIVVHQQKFPNREEYGNRDDEDEDVEEAEEEGFFDPRETMSMASSSSDAEDTSTPHRFGFRTGAPFCSNNQSDFYDAPEDFLSEGSVAESCPSNKENLETEILALKINLLEEIERRKEAENALVNMRLQWNRLADSLSRVGIAFPKITQEGAPPQIDPDAVQQEIVVTRVVSEAIQMAIARDEAEEAAKVVIESKNLEISRLRDKVQYYEAVNREMSQRNQEVVEFARQKREKRRRRHQWIWGCIGLSISVGASLLAYSYLQTSEGVTGDDAAASQGTVDAGETSDFS